MGLKISRRTAVRTIAAGAGAAASGALPMPWMSRKHALAADPIILGVPTSQTAAAGVADDLDHLNGTTLAMEEAIAACIDAKVHAISNAFLFVPIPAMDVSAKYKCPYLQGNTQRAATEAFKADPEKYSHVFQTDPSEVNYGWTYPLWLEHEEAMGVWKPKNRKVHIIQEQVAYCQTI